MHCNNHYNFAYITQMKLASITTAVISVWSVYASVIPRDVNQPRAHDRQITFNKNFNDAGNSFVPNSVTTYAKSWNENYETYKLHSLLHRPALQEDDETKSKNVDNLKNQKGSDFDTTQISLNSRDNSGNNNGDKENSSFQPIQRSPSKTHMDLHLIRRDGTAYSNKNQADNGLYIINTSTRVSRNKPSSTVAAKSSSSRRVKGKDSTRPSSKCISPLGAGFKIPDFNGTSAGAPNSTLSGKSKSPSQDFTNGSGVRPISCAVLGITVALAWSTYML